MKEMICQHCGARLKWDGISRTVKCGFCGAEYLMHPKEERGGQLPAYGDGTVVPMTIYGDAFIQDRPFIKSYVPVGWRIMTGQADRIDMMGNPIVPEIRLTAPDESAFIFFRGLSHYKHIEPNAMNARLQGQLRQSATRFVEASNNYKYLSVMLGHSSIKITMDLYVHQTEESQAQETDKFMDYLATVGIA